MKVLDLACPHSHRFEGWFGSDEDFESQLSRRLVTCPVCDSSEVQRLPSAPRLNLSGAIQAERAAGRRQREAQEASAGATLSGAPGQAAPVPAVPAQAMPASQAQGAWLAAMRKLIAETENVGERFADEARRMHYDEVPARSISGVASRDEFLELLDEGIEVLPLPISAALKEPLQ